MYMGELARLAMVRFTKEKLLFGGVGSDALFTRGQFFTKYVSEIETDKPGQFIYCREILDELGLDHATDADCANVRYICERVSSRAAHLVSAGIAALINKMDEPSVTVSIFFYISLFLGFDNFTTNFFLDYFDIFTLELKKKKSSKRQ